MWSIGFGLERLGLLAVARPVVSLSMFVLLCLVAATGLPHLKPDDALSDLFRSGSQTYLDYQRMRERFPSSEFDLLVLAESDALLTPEGLEAVRSMHLDLELVPPVAGVVSAFSMRRVPPRGATPPQLIPDDLPGGQALGAIIEDALHHPLVEGRLLERTTGTAGSALLIVSLDRAAIAGQGLEKAVAEVEAALGTITAGSPVRAAMTGTPALQKEIREAIRRDRITYNVAGFSIGFLISLMVFRRLGLVMITSAAPALAVLIGLGTLGHAGFRLNTLVNVIPPLVLVIAFCDSMHLVYRIRREILNGADGRQAARIAVAETGPACALTSLTTSASMLSLVFAPSALIRDFGAAAAFVTMLAFLAVIVVVPALSVIVFRDGVSLRRAQAAAPPRLAGLQATVAAAASLVRGAPGLVSLAGAVLVALCAFGYAALEPRYRLTDQVPERSPAAAVLAAIDARFHVAHPLHVLIERPAGRTAGDSMLDGEAGDALARVPGLAGVSSRATLDRWLADGGADAGEAERIRALLPERVTARVEHKDSGSTLVTAHMADLPAAEAAALAARADAALDPLRALHPDARLTVTGMPPVAAVESTSMIRQLSFNLLGSMAVVVAMIGLAFRSASLALLAVLPNLLPIVAAATILYVLDAGLEYASVVALVVAFGIAVDDSIHFLNHYLLARRGGEGPEMAALTALGDIGPVLILTTAVLVVGLSVTALSTLPPLKIFGLLTMGSLVAALLADSLLLPALIVWSDRLRRGFAARNSRPAG